MLDRARRHARRFPRGFWILVGGESVRNLGLGLFLPYTGLYLTGHLGVSAGVVGILLAINALVGLAAAPLGGVLADRIRRRPGMLAVLRVGGVAAIAFGLASSVVAVGVLLGVWAFAEGI